MLHGTTCALKWRRSMDAHINPDLGEYATIWSGGRAHRRTCFASAGRARACNAESRQRPALERPAEHAQNGMKVLRSLHARANERSLRKGSLDANSGNDGSDKLAQSRESWLYWQGYAELDSGKDQWDGSIRIDVKMRAEVRRR